MNETALTVRSAEVIATEINSIKTETFRFLEAATNYATRQTFEIGKRLIEAKALVDAGKWIDWLRDSVDYSEDTAQNMMRIYREYDAGNPMIQAMSYSQLVALFPLPVEQRQEFVEETGANKLSVKEIKKLIKDKETAEKKLKVAEAKNEKLEQSCESLNKQLTAEQQIAARDKEVASKLLIEKEDLEKELKVLKDAPPKIEKVIEQVPGEVTEEQLQKIREQVRAEYDSIWKSQAKEQMKQNPVLVEINFYFNQVQKELQNISDAMKKVNPNEADKLRDVVGKTILNILYTNFGVS